MNVFYTKCNREFTKSTKAETTGYKIISSNDLLGDCRECPFRLPVKKGWLEAFSHYECRAGSQKPNHDSSWRGSLNDKTTIKVLSLDVDFLERVVTYVRSTEGFAGCSYNQDESDCRRAISIGVEQNKKGIAAKKRLVEEFFTERSEEEMAKCSECCNWTEDESTKGMGKCVVARGWKYQDGPQCKEFNIPYTFVSEQTLESLKVEPVEEIISDEYECADCNYFTDDKAHVGLGHCSESKGLKSKHGTCGNFCPEINNSICTELVPDPDPINADANIEDELQDDEVENAAPEHKLNLKRRYPFNGISDKQICEDLKEDCPYFCDHNDGCSLKLCYGSALKTIIDKFGGVDCSVFYDAINGDLDVPKVQESVTDLTEIVPEAKTQHLFHFTHVDLKDFDYSLVDSDTAEFLHIQTDKINQIKMSSMFSIAGELKKVHSRLANNKSGTFGAWCNSIGISADTAQNYIRTFNYIAEHFGDISDAELIQPSLLIAISKPSAPEQLQQAVLDGDIKTHKEYKTLLAELNRVSEEKISLCDENFKIDQNLRDEERTSQNYLSVLNVERSRVRRLETELKELKSKPIDVAVQEVIPPEIQEKADQADGLLIEIEKQEAEIDGLRHQLGQAQTVNQPTLEDGVTENMAFVRRELRVVSDIPDKEFEDTLMWLKDSPAKVVDEFIDMGQRAIDNIQKFVTRLEVQIG